MNSNRAHTVTWIGIIIALMSLVASIFFGALQSLPIVWTKKTVREWWRERHASARPSSQSSPKEAKNKTPEPATLSFAPKSENVRPAAHNDYDEIQHLRMSPVTGEEEETATPEVLAARMGNVATPDVWGSSYPIPGCALVDEQIYWVAVAAGGTGKFAYSWNVDGNEVKKGRVLPISYSAPGTKGAIAHITSGNLTINRLATAAIVPRVRTHVAKLEAITSFKYEDTDRDLAARLDGGKLEGGGSEVTVHLESEVIRFLPFQISRVGLSGTKVISGPNSWLGELSLRLLEVPERRRVPADTKSWMLGLRPEDVQNVIGKPTLRYDQKTTDMPESNELDDGKNKGFVYYLQDDAKKEMLLNIWFEDNRCSTATVRFLR